jgi:DNA-directed RNA polymerase specialized sigma24 family protein
MKQPEKVRVFKNELRNYNYYLQEIATLDESIEEIYYKLGGVRGIDPSKEPLHSPPDKDLEYKLRDRIEILEAKKRLPEAKIREIDRILDRMETSLRRAVMAVYCEGKTIRYVAYQNNMSSSGMDLRITNAIKKALQ